MGQAAVPAYVGHDFSACPPGHRFNLYFPVWNAQWLLDKDEAKAAALRKVLNLPPHTASLLKQLSERQVRLVQALPEAQCCVIDALSTAPFATGLGLEHPIENGFSFLSPYGLPYLAGSSVKGVLRRAAEELRDEGEASIDNALIDALFGPENTPAARRGALTCWDVLPQFDALTLEIMTPHQGHYLQGSDSPHDAGQPIPITFLAVPAGSRFRFVLRFDPSPVPLACRAALADWQPLVRRIVQQAFDWLGFGAKTAVGYGAMGVDPEAQAIKIALQLADQKRKANELALQQRQQQLKDASPADRAIFEFLDQRADQNQPELNALIDGLDKGRFGDMAATVAQVVKLKMQAANRWKDASTKKNLEKDREYQDTLKVKGRLLK